MTFAYLVYTLLFSFSLIMMWLYLKARNRADKGYRIDSYVYLGIFFIAFSLVVGLRYNVGNDYPSYVRNFIDISKNFNKMEIGFQFCNTLLKSLGFSFPSIFILVAFLQMLFFIKSFDFYPHLLIWGMFMYFATLQFFISLNVLRQTLAFCIFLYGIRFIVAQALWKYILCIVLAGLFHKSAFSLILFYPILNKVNLSVKLQYILKSAE